MDVLDDPDTYQNRSVSEVAKELFQEHYLHPLGDDVGYVQLEKMHVEGTQCGELVEKTAAALNEDAVMLMLLAVQKSNVELSVKTAWRRVHKLDASEVENVIETCLFTFPFIWVPTFSKSLQPNNWNDFEFVNGFKYKNSPEMMNPLARPILNSVTKQIMTLHTIQNLIIHKSSHLHLIFAVILILKHATLLRLSNLQESALTQAELDYQKANMDLVIQQHLMAYAPEHSVEQFASFIMGTDIVPQPR